MFFSRKFLIKKIKVLNVLLVGFICVYYIKFCYNDKNYNEYFVVIVIYFLIRIIIILNWFII